jgi:hypothetical protein
MGSCNQTGSGRTREHAERNPKHRADLERFSLMLLETMISIRCEQWAEFYEHVVRTERRPVGRSKEIFFSLAWPDYAQKKS